MLPQASFAPDSPLAERRVFPTIRQKGSIEMTTGWIVLTVLMDVGVTAIVAGVSILVPLRAGRDAHLLGLPQQAVIVTFAPEATSESVAGVALA
jgi:hypothetical protein